MKFEFTPNGNLRIIAESADAEMLANMKTRNGANDVGFMADMLEETGWSPNGRLLQVQPENIAALTEAPILTDDRTIEDNGDVTVHGRVWWFPNYMVTNFADELIENGETIFNLAPAN